MPAVNERNDSAEEVTIRFCTVNRSSNGLFSGSHTGLAAPPKILVRRAVRQDDKQAVIGPGRTQPCEPGQSPDVMRRRR